MTERFATIGLSPACLSLCWPRLSRCSEENGVLPAEERIPLEWHSCP